MKGMPDRIAKLRDEVNSRKPKKDFSYMLKRIASLSKPLSQKPSNFTKKKKEDKKEDPKANGKKNGK